MKERLRIHWGVIKTLQSKCKGGRHYARVTKRRTKRDFAKCLTWLANRYPDAVTIHLVMDNLNTHTESALVKTYGALEGEKPWDHIARMLSRFRQ